MTKSTLLRRRRPAHTTKLPVEDRSGRTGVRYLGNLIEELGGTDDIVWKKWAAWSLDYAPHWTTNVLVDVFPATDFTGRNLQMEWLLESRVNMVLVCNVVYAELAHPSGVEGSSLDITLVSTLEHTVSQWTMTWPTKPGFVGGGTGGQEGLAPVFSLISLLAPMRFWQPTYSLREMMVFTKLISQS